MSTEATIVWFRQDLRLADNPALNAASAQGPIIPLYILDDANAGDWAMGGASRWWLHHSLSALDQSLGGKLWVMAGDPVQLLTELANSTGAGAVVWNRCYEPWRIARDSHIKSQLRDSGLEVRSYNGSLLWEPQQAVKADGTPYRVFTPFYKNAVAQLPVEEPASPGGPLQLHRCAQGADKIDQLQLLPAIPWYRHMETQWTPGEAGAQSRLQAFLNQGISSYKDGRDFPAARSVSRLSPHLHFGEIAPQRVWHCADDVGRLQGNEAQAEHFRRELAWREFSYSLLTHFPALTDSNLNRQFDQFPWQHDAAALEAWRRGQTGYPIVDAGMRELWQTGYMHNRVRMIVGSFLVKNLMLHWQLGARWFWDCLLDADLANNSCSWQWVAGCGADAAPYFRVFNPTTQARKFDPEGSYIRRYVPELAQLPTRHIHAPQEAPLPLLQQAGVRLGKDYPKPIVELKESRERALAAYQALRQQTAAA